MQSLKISTVLDLNFSNDMNTLLIHSTIIFVNSSSKDSFPYESKDLDIHCSLLYGQRLEQCLVHSKHSSILAK